MTTNSIGYKKFPMDFYEDHNTAFIKPKRNMDKFKMELTWHNCKTCQPEEDSNGCLIVTNGKLIYEVAWSRFWQGFGSHNIEIKDEDLINWWWADIVHTVHKTPEFKEALK